jgi:hypothetical protein
MERWKRCDREFQTGINKTKTSNPALMQALSLQWNFWQKIKYSQAFIWQLDLVELNMEMAERFTSGILPGLSRRAKRIVRQRSRRRS